ncbi:MAG: ribonuclease E/G [Alphaproteobacteria bacterium]|nr:ribonuclease E/G [Alphaproteobacteria bacterium]|tara:strand:+ start:35 stop:2482 length:2448 start_codon:yes stop_codon:yes gene_type:complete
MTTRMLIDAAHPEETRVVVVKGSRLEEFDMESATRQQLRGNIYLAKVTRVEPSLQAAFVDYGGNRHGFLAFSDIHPDYYQIPIADREALLEQQAAIQAAQDLSEEEADDAGETSEADDELDRDDEPDVDDDDTEPDNEDTSWEGTDTSDNDENEADQADALDEIPGDSESNVAEEELAAGAASAEDQEDEDDASEPTGYEGIADLDEWRRQLTRRYKIQEVIKRRQILLVQVVKEERGNKGAALTTYLSLAGRYCVLMPNSTRGGGISRKITNTADRKKLRGIIEGLNVPDGMRLIVRTAGQSRNKAEIRRDYEYLLRLWDSIRELTLSSTAPSLIYEDANIIKRSIRDLYTKDISEILVDGEDGHKSAKSFMKMLMPSHAKRVQPYQDRIPLFQRYRIEEQFSSMHSPTVQLKSGGYIVINSTEALVAVDVNSGRSTRERNIEETAYKTNLEAAEEIARQLRLRDLAGLIVIDFIDMDENRNARRVERCLKDCLKTDRARIQVGRISKFGLLEMSRQRLRPSLIEASTEVCPHCQGAGVVRSTESSALHILHAIEEEGIQGRSTEITVHMSTAVALYILNQKRNSLIALEERFGLRVNVEGDDTLNPPDYRLERVSSRAAAAKPAKDESKDKEKEKTETRQSAAEAEESSEDAPKKRRRRGRRGGRRRRKKEEATEAVEAAATETDSSEPGAQTEPVDSADNEPDQTVSEDVAPAEGSQEATPVEAEEPDTADGQVSASDQTDVEEQPLADSDPSTEEAILVHSMDVVSNAGIDAVEPDPSDETEPPTALTKHAAEEEESIKPKRRGWWQRTSA